MSRLASFILLPLFICLGMPSAVAADLVLKPAATVKGAIIHLGDIFAGTGTRATVGIAEAPPPGSKMILGSDWLAALARSQHLDWHPGSGFDQVVVERASRIIGADEIVDQLKQVLQNRTPLDGAEVKLDHGDLRLAVAMDASSTLVFGDITYDPASGRFATTVSTADGGSVPNQLRLSGQIVRYSEVPTPTRLIAPGEVIGKDDVVMVRLRNDRLAQGVVTQLSDLVGMTPRRSLQPGEAVRAADIVVPVVVHRNSLVTIVLETPTMHLTAEGKATEDGGLGAVIRVANTHSNRVIDAVVTGPNTVRVESPL